MTTIKQCCATGSLHTGTPTGKIEKMYNFNVYKAEPPSGTSPKGVVVILPDMFGWELPNNRILADEYAKKGDFLVLLPDFMDGYVVPVTLLKSIEAITAPGILAKLASIFHILKLAYWAVPFLIKNKASTVQPRMLSFFQALNSDFPTMPIGCAGFCWGGGYTIRMCNAEDRNAASGPLFDVGFVAHPSAVKIPADIEAVKLPLSVAAAGIDMQVSPEQAQEIKKILDEKTERGGLEGVEHELVFYEGANHGFAVRADEKDLEQAEMGKRAEAQAVAWFEKQFAKVQKAPAGGMQAES